MLQVVSTHAASNLSSKRAKCASNAIRDGSYGNSSAYDTRRKTKSYFNVIYVNFTTYFRYSVEIKCRQAERC